MFQVSITQNNDLFFNLQLDENIEKGLLKCSWHGYTDVEKVKRGSRLLTFYIREEKSSLLLVDSRSEEGPWSDSHEWILNDWMPEAKAYGLKKTAILSSKDMFSLVSAKEYERRSKNKGFKVRIFDDEKSALSWLKN